jgi:hypothetical protein
MKYNLLGQRGPEGQTNPASPEAGPYIYDEAPGLKNGVPSPDAENKGLDSKGNPVDSSGHQDKINQSTPQDNNQQEETKPKEVPGYVKDYEALIKNFKPGTEEWKKEVFAIAGRYGVSGLQIISEYAQYATGPVNTEELNSYLEDANLPGGDSTTQNNDTSTEKDEYGFTTKDYEKGIPIYRKDAPKGGETVYSYTDLKKAIGNGYSLTTVDITEGPDAGTSAADAGRDKVTEGETTENGTTETGTTTGFADTQIWEKDGKKYVVWQIPGTTMFMRYEASDADLDMLYSGRERPSTISATDTMWTSSVFFGAVNELPDTVITTGDSPFTGFLSNFDKATLGRPWLKTDDEMFALWVEGYVENRDITEEEWSNTEWWNRSTKEARDWLILSKGRGVGDSDFPADAKRYLDQNRTIYLQLMKDAGIANAGNIRDANGLTLAQWFADRVTFGDFDDVKAQEQIKALSDSTSGIPVDESITNWLQGKGEVDQTQTGYASARALARKWLGPAYGKLDDEKLAEYAGIIRNAENPDVGADILSEKLKAQRKVLFSTDLYDENLTYDDIAAPWQNYSYQFLGQRIDETSENWLNVLLANNQTEAIKELTAYGLNKNISKVVDTMSDNLAGAVGVSESGIQRGFST